MSHLLCVHTWTCPWAEWLIAQGILLAHEECRHCRARRTTKTSLEPQDPQTVLQQLGIAAS